MHWLKLIHIALMTLKDRLFLLPSIFYLFMFPLETERKVKPFVQGGTSDYTAHEILESRRNWFSTNFQLII